jgi:type I restriction-modification system DNA methylase subunit
VPNPSASSSASYGDSRGSVGTQVADFLADLLNIKPDEMVIDPAGGEADLLLAANRQVRQNHGAAADIYGIDI